MTGYKLIFVFAYTCNLKCAQIALIDNFLIRTLAAQFLIYTLWECLHCNLTNCSNVVFKKILKHLLDFTVLNFEPLLGPSSFLRVHDLNNFESKLSKNVWQLSHKLKNCNFHVDFKNSFFFSLLNFKPFLGQRFWSGGHVEQKRQAHWKQQMYLTKYYLKR